jgi:predicted nucleotidyltransferase
MSQAAIIPVIQHYLAEVSKAGIPVDGAILYGSFARDQDTPDSDIDLIVLSAKFDVEKTQQDVSLLWRLRCRTDARIEPIAAGVREFAVDRGSPILAIARAEGIMIPAIEKTSASD